jgi:hypothetical protein
MQLPDFAVEQFKALPLRVIGQFSAGCARRVEDLAQLREGYPQGKGRREAIEAPLRMAGALARGSVALPVGSQFVAHNAGRAVTGARPISEAAFTAEAGGDDDGSV